jgi:hypothetical protein
MLFFLQIVYLNCLSGGMMPQSSSFYNQWPTLSDYGWYTPRDFTWLTPSDYEWPTSGDYAWSIPGDAGWYTPRDSTWPTSGDHGWPILGGSTWPIITRSITGRRAKSRGNGRRCQRSSRRCRNRNERNPCAGWEPAQGSVLSSQNSGQYRLTSSRRASSSRLLLPAHVD